MNNMGNERINILIASDINYAPYYGVMLTSLFKHNKDSLFDVYFLTDRTIVGKDAAKLERLTSFYKARLFVIPINVDLVQNFPEIIHITLPTYYHLFLANLLPETIHKIIYMDGDMIVNGDIRPLWNVDISNYACAQVIDSAFNDETFYQRLGYDQKWRYCNNGTTIYNLDYLRKIDFSNSATRFIKENMDRILWLDQDAENALLHDKILRLPITYNFQTHFFTQRHWGTYSVDFQQEILTVAQKPIIIHFCGPLKPWQYQYYLMPFASLWNKACKNSLWKNYTIRKPRIKYIKHLLKRFLKRSTLLDTRNKEYIKESLQFS